MNYNEILHHCDQYPSPRYFIKGSAELIGSFPSNQNTLYLLCLFYSDNEIITVCCRPEICTLIGWIETSRLCLSFSKVSLNEIIYALFHKLKILLKSAYFQLLNIFKYEVLKCKKFLSKCKSSNWQN